MVTNRADSRTVRWTLFILILVISPGFCAGVKASERPSYLGFETAYPGNGFDYSRSFDGARIPYDSLRMTILRVDRSGEIVGFVPTDTADTTLDQDLVDHLQYIKFEPARFEGDRVDSRLPAFVRYRPNGVAPAITFPVDSETVITDRHLYELTLRLNDIHPPTIESFPSFHATVTRNDSLPIYPWVLLRVDLDVAGRPVAIDTVRTTLPGFTDQYRSACNWAEYTPAVVNGKPRAHHLFVLLRLFPEVTYPSPDIEPATVDSLPLLRRLAVSSISDTVGLMSKPVPRNVSGGQLLLTGSNVGLSDVRVLCEVNTSGSVRALRVGSGNRHRISEYRRMFRLLRFYPALDYSGDPVRFTGPIHLASDNSGIVRVDFLWLPADGLLYSPQVIEQ